MPDNKALLLVTMEPSAGFEDEFNDWYDTEHFPQRMGLPGFETGSRWACLSGWPRWLAIYDVASRAALETPEYLAVSLANATPWSKRVAARTTGRMRIVADQIAPGAALASPLQQVSRLLMARFPGVAKPVEAAQQLRDAADSIVGRTQTRVFESDAEAGRDLWLLAEFDRPMSPERVTDALATVGGIGANLFNLYAPYWRK
jgi:hypothetical protein